MRRSPTLGHLVLSTAVALSAGCKSEAVVGLLVERSRPAPRAASLVPTSVDLLLMVDNSRSMADKQALLAQAVPDLVHRLVNPLCLDDASGQPVPAAAQPGPSDPCPAASTREFPAVTDIHLGVISSSIGGHGSDACPASVGCVGSGKNTSNDDHAHLLARADPCDVAAVPTYEGKAFLAWDPTATQQPPGESDPTALSLAMTDLVVGAGQIGCGYEAQLESWLRFLVDPMPYASITVQDGVATKVGVDQILLQQRADFLRPDSFLAIVMLTDENDCSVVDGGAAYFATQIENDDGSAFHLPRATAVCAANPDDPCCYSCGQADVPEGCQPDPTCADPTLTDLDDNINLRCFEQKRRFGVDFLYPVQRYVNALTKTAFDPSDPALEGPPVVQNPIFSDLVPDDDRTEIRDPGLVVLTGIVGVPWQLVARDPADPASGPKGAAELDEPGPDGLTTWDRILGDPSAHVAPADPHMIESVEPRAGLGTSGDDGVHGHEYSVDKRSDLQYACTFPLPTPRDCTDAEEVAKNCDCASAGNDSPVCAPNPGDGGSPTLQVRAKAYPGLRELGVLRGLGPQGVVASICAPSVDPDDAASGYRPTMMRLVDTMRSRLAP